MYGSLDLIAAKGKQQEFVNEARQRKMAEDAKETESRKSLWQRAVQTFKRENKTRVAVKTSEATSL